jgi:hypothetical protein
LQEEDPKCGRQAGACVSRCGRGLGRRCHCRHVTEEKIFMNDLIYLTNRKDFQSEQVMTSTISNDNLFEMTMRNLDQLLKYWSNDENTTEERQRKNV